MSDKCKHMTSRCEREEIVEIKSKARATVHPLGPCKVDFPIEIDVRTKPCRIECARLVTDDCGKPKGCTFKVSFDFDIDGHIKGPCEKTTRCPVQVVVDAEHKVHCDKPGPAPCPCPPPPCGPVRSRRR